ncbi:MAG: GNAT family N-acetyltransferase [Alphaproteobacteria bacterium]|nr:GNAT family N-acetyltransferase [Alphaproteobacteria bacterium]
MSLWTQLIKTAQQGWRRGWLQPGKSLAVRHEHPTVMVPIVSLDERHRAKIMFHLREMGPEDRILRFGYPATDEQIERYVNGINFQRDHIDGIFNVALRLEALSHLGLERPEQGEPRAEFGVSVRQKSRGKGLGNRMFECAMVHARHEGIGLFYIHALSENAPMLAIARRHGARVERDGSETQAYLRLPPPDMESELEDWVNDQYGRINYDVKEQDKQFVDVVSQVQEIREGVREARHKSGS